MKMSKKLLHTLKRVGYLGGLLVFWVASSLRAQPQAYTPAQVERLAKLSELYGHIKFFHPYLGYKPINWDSAYAANAPLIAHATTDAETAAALRRLLAVLGDEATTVTLAGAKAAAAPTSAVDSVQVFWGADNTLVLKANAYAGADDYRAVLIKVGRFVQLLPRARALLFDLRSPRPITYEQAGGFYYALRYTRFSRYLSAQPYTTPAMRLRGHSGFAPETGESSGGYYSYFYTKPGDIVQPYAAARNRPTAILVNEYAALPAAFYALRNQPHVRFFSTGSLTDANLAEGERFAFSDALSVTFRTSELVNADGSLGLQGLVPVPVTVRPEAAGAYALAQLHQPRPALSMPRPAPAPASARPPVYPPAPYPALGYRLLAGAKMWATVHYFYAYRDLMPDSWDAALRPALAELAAAPTTTAYVLAVAHFYHHLQDGHGFINGPSIREYLGTGGTPVEIRFIEGQPTISKLYGDSLQAKGLRVGDVLTAVNGEPIADRVARLAAIRSASNEWTRLHYVAAWLLRAPVGTPLTVTLREADNRAKTVVLGTVPINTINTLHPTDAPFRVLPGNIGYANLDILESEDTDKMFAALQDTRAIIFDMRGYPHGTAWSVAPRLTEKNRPGAANFFRYTPTTPSISGQDGILTEKTFFTQPIPPNTGKPVYKGKTVMLIDERTQSQAEHTGLFFEAANGTEFIGSPTAGANGDVTYFIIPGGLSLAFSGHDVRHADGRQLQQVGLQPKIVVRPTLKGIQKGQDEVLDRALNYLQDRRFKRISKI